MRGYNVFLLPSVGEGIANVVLEAMAAQIPVVTTACGGTKEFITDGENGFIVPPYSGSAIAEAIERVGNLKEEEISKIRSDALKTIREQFSPAQQVADFESFYNSLIAA
jgi:glycosyltransferase involved in cell wall biosynthesis